jgi:hypothetical protein
MIHLLQSTAGRPREENRAAALARVRIVPRAGKKAFLAEWNQVVIEYQA